MDIKKARLEELLFILELKKLDLKLKDDLQNTWTEQEIYRVLLSHYLKENNREASKEELYKWLKHKARFSLLASLLKIQIQNLIHSDNLIDHFIVNNFHPLLEIIENLITIWSQEEKSTTTLPSMSISEVHTLVREFLIEVDPTLEWLTIYNEMLENNNLKILNDDPNLMALIGRENSCFHHQGKLVITVYLKGNIEDFTAIVHEFAHYINFYHHPNAKICRTLLESSSIFYEYYGLLFLERKGYSREITEVMRKDRIAHTYSISQHIYDICNYLKEFIETHEIKEQTEKDACLTCDQCIIQLISYPHNFYICYPYIIGNYLALKGMEQIASGNNILPKIKELTENLDDISPTTFFQTVGCEIEESPETDEIIRAAKSLSLSN